MKATLLAVFISLTVTGMAFAQDYIVQEVTGNVEKSAGSGNWTPVKAGEVLKAETVIRTAADSSITVKSGGQTHAIGPMRNGRIANLARSGAIQVQGRVSQTDTSEVNQGTGRVSTASARASSSADDIEIEEE